MLAIPIIRIVLLFHALCTVLLQRFIGRRSTSQWRQRDFLTCVEFSSVSYTAWGDCELILALMILHYCFTITSFQRWYPFAIPLCFFNCLLLSLLASDSHFMLANIVWCKILVRLLHLGQGILELRRSLYTLPDSNSFTIFSVEKKLLLWEVALFIARSSSAIDGDVIFLCFLE